MGGDKMKERGGERKGELKERRRGGKGREEKREK